MNSVCWGCGIGDIAERSVSRARDLHNIIIGTPQALLNASYSCQPYIVYGNQNGFSSQLNLPDLNLPLVLCKTAREAAEHTKIKRNKQGEITKIVFSWLKENSSSKKPNQRPAIMGEITLQKNSLIIETDLLKRYNYD